ITVLALQIVECVVMNQGEMFAGLKAIPQNRDQAGILLDRQDLARLFKNQFRERTKAGPDFQNFIGFGQLGTVNNATELVAVMQEILAKRFGELDVPGRQHLLHFRELHGGIWRESALATARTEAASCDSEMVSGGVKLITFECSPSGRRMKP